MESQTECSGDSLEVNVLRGAHHAIEVGTVRGLGNREVLEDATAAIVPDNHLNLAAQCGECADVVLCREVTEDNTGHPVLCRNRVGLRRRRDALCGRDRSVDSGQSTIRVNAKRLAGQNRVGDANQS